MPRTDRDCRNDPFSGSRLHDNQPPEIKPYDVGTTVDSMVAHCDGARWCVVTRAMQVLEVFFNRDEVPTA